MFFTLGHDVFDENRNIKVIYIFILIFMEFFFLEIKAHLFIIINYYYLLLIICFKAQSSYSELIKDFDKLDLALCGGAVLG